MSDEQVNSNLFLAQIEQALQRAMVLETKMTKYYEPFAIKWSQTLGWDVLHLTVEVDDEFIEELSKAPEFHLVSWPPSTLGHVNKCLVVFQNECYQLERRMCVIEIAVFALNARHGLTPPPPRYAHYRLASEPG